MKGKYVYLFETELPYSKNLNWPDINNFRHILYKKNIELPNLQDLLEDHNMSDLDYYDACSYYYSNIISSSDQYPYYCFKITRHQDIMTIKIASFLNYDLGSIGFDKYNDFEVDIYDSKKGFFVGIKKIESLLKSIAQFCGNIANVNTNHISIKKQACFALEESIIIPYNRLLPSIRDFRFFMHKQGFVTHHGVDDNPFYIQEQINSLKASNEMKYEYYYDISFHDEDEQRFFLTIEKQQNNLCIEVKRIMQIEFDNFNNTNYTEFYDLYDKEAGLFVMIAKLSTLSKHVQNFLESTEANEEDYDFDTDVAFDEKGKLVIVRVNTLQRNIMENLDPTENFDPTLVITDTENNEV